MIQKNHKYNLFNGNRKEIGVCLFIAVITFFIYGRVATYEFINFDDNLYVTANKNIQSGITIKSIKWAFGYNEVAYWHPLSLISHMIDFTLFGLNPGRHHLINLIFHILNSIFLFIILKQTTGAMWRSAIVASFFAVHPINVESVAWIAERKNVLSVFFWMLTIYAYIFYAKKQNIYRYMAVFIFFLLGLLSKPTIVTMPFVLLLFDYWPLGRIKPGLEKGILLKVIFEKIPLFILSLISVIISSLSLKYGSFLVSHISVPFSLRIANAVVSYFKYISKIVWPHNLAVYYPFPSAVSLWHFIGAALFILIFSALAFLASKKRGYIFTGWFWYAVTLVPVSGIMQGGLWPAMADRWAYIPSAGLFILLVWGLHELLVERIKISKLPICLILATCLSVMIPVAYMQTGHWKNSYTLYRHALEVTEGSDLVHNNMGTYLFRLNRLKEAKDNFTEAVVINPYYVESLNNLGVIFYSEGEYNKAIKYYRKALNVNPNFSDAHNNLGIAMISIGKTDDAISHFKKALMLNPDNRGIAGNLKKALTIKTVSENKRAGMNK